MTPAEQGQRWTIRADGPDGRVDHFYADTDLRELEVVPASELEMCQRYFPFLQRSRADYKRRYEEAVQREKALREALERIDERIGGAKATDPYWPIVEWVQGETRAALDQSGKERVEDRRAVVIKLTPLEAKIAQERLALLVRAEPHLRYLNDLLREAVPADQSGRP